jgi:hypothetical protein
MQTVSSVGDSLHFEKSGHFTVDVVLKSLFTGKSSDDVSNSLDPYVPMKVIVTNIQRRLYNTL